MRVCFGRRNQRVRESGLQEPDSGTDGSYSYRCLKKCQHISVRGFLSLDPLQYIPEPYSDPDGPVGS